VNLSRSRTARTAHVGFQQVIGARASLATNVRGEFALLVSFRVEESRTQISFRARREGAFLHAEESE